MNFAPDETSLLIAQSVERSIAGVSTDPAACGRALAALDLLEIDLGHADGLLQAGAASQVLGRLNAHFSLGDQLTAAAVLAAAGPELAGLLASVLAGRPVVAVGCRTGTGRAVVTTVPGPQAIVIGDLDGSWSVFGLDEIELHRPGFFNPEAPQALVELGAQARALAFARIPLLLERNLMLQSADLLGTAAEMLNRTIEYTKERVQFGQPIGSFQALQHKLADDFALVNAAEGVLQYALWAGGQAALDAESKSAWALAAHAITADYGFKVMKDAIQLHGGVAATEELWVHRWARRVARLAVYQGNASQHYAALGEKLRAGVELAVGGD